MEDTQNKNGTRNLEPLLLLGSKAGTVSRLYISRHAESQRATRVPKGASFTESLQLPLCLRDYGKGGQPTWMCITASLPVGGQ